MDPNTTQRHFLVNWEATWPKFLGEMDKQNIHIFKLDLQHLTDSRECVRKSDIDLFTPLLLCIVCEWVPEQINKGGPLYFQLHVNC